MKSILIKIKKRKEEDIVKYFKSEDEQINNIKYI